MDPVKILEGHQIRNQAIREASKLGDSDVQRFYCGRTAFLTGGSGFLGKQLIEKLFRSCKIAKVYMLLRPKKEHGIKQRLEVLLKDTVFDLLREEQPDFVNKIVAVEGDAAEINLGIHDEDWKILTKEVDIIFHVAATTRFDETLRVATLINLRGTRECLKLGKACKKLSSYVHVSTAYTHATSQRVGGEVPEQFYECPVPPDTMLALADIDDDRLAGITNNLIKDWPNTYCFTKAIAEELIRTTSDGLPICIVRPGIVITSYTEPSPGWLDHNAVYSASGILLGIFLGIIHTLHVKQDIKIGIIPCDFVNNAIIAAGREVAVKQAKGGNDTTIYALSSPNSNPVLWETVTSTLREEGSKLTTPKEMYYAFSYEIKFKFLFNIFSLIFSFIPGYIADFICLLLGKPRRFAKVADKIYKMCSSFSFFLTNEWIFVDNNTTHLYDNLSKQDQTIFNFQIKDIKWREMIVIWLLGVRTYILKDGLEKTGYPFNRHNLLRIIHYVVVSLYFYGLWKFGYFVFCTISYLFQTIIYFCREIILV